MIDLNHLEQYRENNRIEAKRAMGGLPKSLWETYSAFANTMGGLLLLGVEEREDKSLRALTLPDPQRLLKEFWAILNDVNRVSVNVLSRDSVSVEQTGGGRIIVIRVPRARRTDRPVYIDGDPMWGAYRRSGEGDYRCTPEEVRAMQRDAALKSQDMALLPALTLEALDPDSLRRYRAQVRACRPGCAWQEESDPDFLCRAGGAGRDRNNVVHPAAAGLLMLGRAEEITRQFPFFSLEYREQSAPGADWTCPLSAGPGGWHGNLYDFYCQASDRLCRGVGALPVRSALREALANCLINADYHSRQGILVLRQPDSVSFTNPGGLRIDPRAALGGGISDPRNSALTGLLNLIGVGTGTGSGIPSMYGVWSAQGWPPPSIREQFDPERITLTLPMSAARPLAIPTGSSADMPARTALQKAAIIQHLTDRSEASSSELAALLGVSRPRVRSLLRQLAAAQLVVPKGESRSRRYRLKR